MSEPASKRGRSEMWQYFDLIVHDKVRCLLCTSELKYHNNTSSMKRHFTAKHSRHGTAAAASAVSAGVNQEENTGAATGGVDRKQELDNALFEMVVKDHQPFTIVEDSGFKDLVALLDPTYILPSRQALGTMVDRRYEEEKAKAKAVFSKCGDIVTKKRNRLKPKTVEKIIFLNKNL